MKKTRVTFIVIFCLTILYILTVKFFWTEREESWKYVLELEEILYNLSIAYIAAFIFYIIDVWIPKNDEQRKVNERLALPLTRLLNHMKIPLLIIYETYYEENISFDSITKEINNEAVSKMNLLKDDTPMIIWSKDKPAKFREFLIEHINDVNMYVEKITKFPVTLDIDLIEILDEIETSTYHEKLLWIYGNSCFNDIRMQNVTIAKETYQYYLLYYKLKDYIKKNNIKIYKDISAD